MERVNLTPEQATLLIPIYSKAHENKKSNPILRDEKAASILEHVDFDFKTLNIPEKTNVMMSIRAKIMDDFTRDFIQNTKSHPQTLVLHLGCGLDSRYERVGCPFVLWYDVDFEKVIQLRKAFYSETQHYHMLGSSVTEEEWLEVLPTNASEVLVIAEGLLMYLSESEIKTLIQRLETRFTRFTLIYDAFSKLTARNVGRHPSLKETGASVKWGIDDPMDFTAYGRQVKFISERFFTSPKFIATMNPGMRLAFNLAHHFKTARTAHRILIYTLGK